MSLFEKHKLLFSFFMAIRIYETGQDTSDFDAKLKELDRIGELQNNSNFGSSKSNTLGGSQRITIGAPS
jgi:hypothetical protein